MQLIREIMQIWNHHPHITTKVLAASIRSPEHVHQCLLSGVHSCTMPASIFRQLVNHPLTDNGIEMFLADWADVEARGDSLTT
jgi:transaldolase